MTRSYDDTPMLMLIVQDGPDYSVYGPFEDTRTAQIFARAFREFHDIPGHDNIEPTPEENEAWTAEGCYFGIHEATAPELAGNLDMSEPGVRGNDDDRYQET